MKTAYIELNTTNQIHTLSSKDSADSFVYLGIYMFPSTKVTSLNDILSRDFDYFIIDMGVLTNYTAKEFSKCQKQFLICSFCEWKKRNSLEKIQNLFQENILKEKDVILLKTFHNKSTNSVVFSRNTKNFPLLSNPFQLPVDVFSDLNNLLI